MSIDWFTFAAQLLNFILLLWLLKRFLYKPIQDAIADREKRISAELANAAAVEREAQQQRERFQRNNEELERRRAALLEKARQEARDEYQHLVEEARKASDAVGRKRMRALQNSVDNLNRAIGRRVQQEVFAISRKVLTELASESLEERMTAGFVTHLRELDEKQLSVLRAVVGSDARVQVRSAFELPPPQCDSIREALGEIAGAGIEPQFEVEPDLVSGIELIVSGHKLAWSISDYLATLQKSVTEIMPTNNDESGRDGDDDSSGQQERR